MSQNQQQRRTCGSMTEHHRLMNENSAYSRSRKKIEERAKAYSDGRRSSARVGITTISVVVHVIWNKQEQNISDKQILSQINVLNQDFRKKNPDTEKVPTVWQSIIGDARIEFALANTDPDGNPSSGITRTQTKTETFLQQGNPVKFSGSGGADAWPAEDYLNIWVCQLEDELLGYAQFPGGPAATDGIVIRHNAFGTLGTAQAPYNLGRTTTHEVGHWLNLYHIWGDDGAGCGGSDEVTDTPNSAGPNYERPTYPSISCDNAPHGDMFMNYMDYTYDDSMCMFTVGQVQRMQATLDGPRLSIDS